MQEREDRLHKERLDKHGRREVSGLHSIPFNNCISCVYPLPADLATLKSHLTDKGHLQIAAKKSAYASKQRKPSAVKYLRDISKCSHQCAEFQQVENDALDLANYAIMTRVSYFFQMHEHMQQVV